MNNPIDLAYTAGFFDGEGSISITARVRKTHNTEHRLWIAVGQKDGATLDWLKDLFGGQVYTVKRDGSFYWVMTNNVAYNFLKQILPYLQYKKIQAELAIEFCEGYSFLKRQPLPPEELERREKIRQQMKLLKKVIVKSKHAGSTTERVNNRKIDATV